MADKKKLYTEDSIESLSPLEFTRLRPGVYCGDTNYSTQLLVEILSNAIDEFNLGHGNQIDITILGDKVIVEDHGQGFIVNQQNDRNRKSADLTALFLFVNKAKAWFTI